MDQQRLSSSKIELVEESVVCREKCFGNRAAFLDGNIRRRWNGFSLMNAQELGMCAAARDPHHSIPDAPQSCALAK
jgi:hypothetical protein